jgi:hypothetical protein
MRGRPHPSPPMAPAGPGDPQDVREALRALVRALARAAAVEELRRLEAQATADQGQRLQS